MSELAYWLAGRHSRLDRESYFKSTADPMSFGLVRTFGPIPYHALATITRINEDGSMEIQ